jgi:hypothetical protein
MFGEFLDVDFDGFQVGTFQKPCGGWGNGGESPPDEEFGVEVDVQRSVVGQDTGV